MSWPPELQSALEEALPYTMGTHTQADIESGLDKGLMQLWPTEESFCLTELVTAPSGLKLVNLFLAGGQMEPLRQLYPIIEGWAKSQGATRVVCLGRKGWERSFLTKDEGFHPTLVYYEKDLGGTNG